MTTVFVHDENGKLQMMNVTIVPTPSKEDYKAAMSKMDEVMRELGLIETYNTVEEKVKAERHKLHLSEDYVAGWCGLTSWEYSCIESGYGKFSQEELDWINKLFLTDFKVEE